MIVNVRNDFKIRNHTYATDVNAKVCNDAKLSSHARMRDRPP